jgi:hypothetical protein
MSLRNGHMLYCSRLGTIGFHPEQYERQPRFFVLPSIPVCGNEMGSYDASGNSEIRPEEQCQLPAIYRRGFLKIARRLFGDRRRRGGKVTYLLDGSDLRFRIESDSADFRLSDPNWILDEIAAALR